MARPCPGRKQPAVSCSWQQRQQEPAPRIRVAAVLSAALRGRQIRLPAHHWKVLNALMACRTPALGGRLCRCEDCGARHFVPHSCRNRHCPACQGAQAFRWLEKQEAALLPVPYFHVVFTLPHDLNPLVAQNRRALHSLLFASASATLLEFGRQRLGAQIGVTAVLHTWGQNLGDHHHLHCIVTGGGMRMDGQGWQPVSHGYLFPVKALSIMFRAKFRDGLKSLHAGGALTFHGALAPLAAPREFRRLLAEALRSRWVVYAKKPFAGPGQVLAYLSRYTHRVAIGSSRIKRLDLDAGTVSFSCKDYRDHGRTKTMKLELPEFLRRFCLHILPAGFVKIRHYGLLGNRGRNQKIEQARQFLGASPPVSAAQAAAVTRNNPGPVCPRCGSANLSVLEWLAPLPRLPRMDSS